MELRPAFKQTDVGVIPEDWESKTFGQVCRVNQGLQVAIEDRLKNPTLNAKKYITIQYLNDGKGIEYIDEYPSSAYCTIDDVLMTRTGNTGIVVSGVEGVFHNNFFKINFDKNILNRNFLIGFLSLSRTQKIILMKAGTSTIPDLNHGDFYSIPLPLPPLHEQRAIAAALSDVDALLAKLDQLIAKKSDIKLAAMQQLLTGQIRLPGFSGEWEVKTLFELAERRKELFDDGDWIESEHITTDGIRLIQTGNIGIGRFIEKDNRKFIYEESFTSLRCKQLQTGDLLVCRLADPAGRACVLPDIGEKKIVTSVDVTIFRPPTDIADRTYLANVFSMPAWFKTVSDRSGGTTHKRISRGALGKISISLPPLPEQRAIATVLSDMDAELASLEARRDKTRALKQGMMQELLTGRIRLV